MASDATTRFSSRVSNYVKYRPSYPPEILDLLQGECGLSPTSIVADIGSGTGISSRFLLKSGATVLGVEPNLGMRAAAECDLADEPKFRSVVGTAEATTLDDQSVDLIVAGQAFHWFDRAKAQTEFRRILKRDAWVALMWNDRSTEGTSFLKGYEAILKRYATDYSEVNHRNIEDASLASFFRREGMQVAAFPNVQWFDWEGLMGRLLSSSYAPEAGHPDHRPMLNALKLLFEANAKDGQVEFAYQTQVFYGQM